VRKKGLRISRSLQRPSKFKQFWIECIDGEHFLTPISVEDASEMAGVIIEEMEENEFKGFLKASNSKTQEEIGQSEKIDCRASG